MLPRPSELNKCFSANPYCVVFFMCVLVFCRTVINYFECLSLLNDLLNDYYTRIRVSLMSLS